MDLQGFVALMMDNLKITLASTETTNKKRDRSSVYKIKVTIIAAEILQIENQCKACKSVLSKTVNTSVSPTLIKLCVSLFAA